MSIIALCWLKALLEEVVKAKTKVFMDVDFWFYIILPYNEFMELLFVRNWSEGSSDSDIVGADEGEETKALKNVSRLEHRLQLKTRG